jgi:hypothetical protein
VERYANHARKRSSALRFSPRANIHTVKRNAEYVGGNKTELLRSQPDEANDNAIDGRQNPAFPTTPAHEDG